MDASVQQTSEVNISCAVSSSSSSISAAACAFRRSTSPLASPYFRP
ncbi:hypothetical protein WJ0W_001941 [Paenibacillus melissococcoides]|uniref:Uncharacterized protein n=1 Tax=Paenibacillus melissococcoides TaxID=2912268 RepID=A0ABN8U4K4_9BACL|nr:hypothetical protein [Paenibacillus melissococcoides]CAH8244711.1 hypothetical protein WJ0W_001941 [Paenibacillus melissococcoides]CAH8708747.1 hypothetical protein WDD9_002024 [Paenibacillus melissococcoides]CAH8709497.1 hypothetical protein HTL2_002310 [Paenibacillus melissococcoides]